MITADELRRFLRYPADQPVDAEDAALAEQVAIGWLSEPTGVETWTTPVPAIVKTWVLELAGIAYENPTSMESDTALDTSSSWRDRRSQILSAARSWAQLNGHGKGTSTSRGCFPRTPAPLGGLDGLRW